MIVSVSILVYIYCFTLFSSEFCFCLKPVCIKLVYIYLLLYLYIFAVFIQKYKTKFVSHSQVRKNFCVTLLFFQHVTQSLLATRIRLFTFSKLSKPRYARFRNSLGKSKNELFLVLKSTITSQLTLLVRLHQSISTAYAFNLHK